MACFNLVRVRKHAKVQVAATQGSFVPRAKKTSTSSWEDVCCAEHRGDLGATMLEQIALRVWRLSTSRLRVSWRRCLP